MASDPVLQAAVLVHRFGLVPRRGGLVAVGKDARDALLAELDDPSAGVIVNDGLMTAAEVARANFDFRREPKALPLVERLEAKVTRAEAARNPVSAISSPAMSSPAMSSPAMSASATGPMQKQDTAGRAKPPPGFNAEVYRDEAKARFGSAYHAAVGFAERLAWFWSNHFCVSAYKVILFCGAFEREAIRAHLRGKFADMLLAVESHPAMLSYLDNVRSMGPNSKAGLRLRRGLNENLAREILELHTLGAGGGYSQKDVIYFAKILTGWSVASPRAEKGGEFSYNPSMHEPGPHRLLGREFPASAVEQGRGALLMLARQPATAKHIAFKLARHFVADAPPSSLVDRLARCFHDTDGDLKEIAKTLVLAPEAGEAPRGKLRPPAEWLLGIARATGVLPDDSGPLLNAHTLLGQPLWKPPAPKGFADESAAWVDGLPARLDIANYFARRYAARADARVIAEEAFGPLLSQETRQTVARAESRQQALTLLLMSPEFQRR